jgi:Protein of unknown function (DUF4231)
MKQNASSLQSISSTRDKDISRASPPRARVVLRVGVTGHRPNKLQFANEQLLRNQIRTALLFLKDTTIELQRSTGAFYLPDPPALRVVSALAEGSDRFVAEAGLGLGFELQCPLPFPREQYAKDFKSEDSQRCFDGLLDQATAVLEMDGSRNTIESPDLENRSYEAAGRIVLNQSDVMIAIWDGNPGEKGGTGQIVTEAERLGIPIIWIESNPPHDLNVKLQNGRKKNPWQSSSQLVSERIGKLVAPPPQPKRKHGEKKTKVDLRHAYFSETQPNFTLGFVWTLFRDLMAEFKIKAPKIWLEPFEQSTEKEWARSRVLSPSLPPAVHDRIDAGLRDHYAWADQLANYYADAYRSAFIFNYLMAGFAVLFAFIGYVTHTHNFQSYESYSDKVGAIASAAEVLTILAILFFTVFGNRRRWHERWIDYRLLAEQLRQQRFLMTLGKVLPSAPGVPAYVSDDDPSNSWVQWHFRAIVRAAGVVDALFNHAYLSAACSFLKTEGVDGQVNYHSSNADRLERADKFLHRAGNILFGLAAIAGTLHLLNYVLHLFDHDGQVALYLTLTTVVAPAFGAALTAIRFQSELERVIKRSRAMQGQLQQIAEELEKCRGADAKPSSSVLGEIATRGAQLMTSEVLDWRTVFLERPLGLPA